MLPIFGRYVPDQQPFSVGNNPWRGKISVTLLNVLQRPDLEIDQRRIFLGAGDFNQITVSVCRGQAEVLVALTGLADAATPAKKLFGAKRDAAALQPAVFGSYAKGCVAGAKKLEDDGPNWQAMRLSRNRHWAHPELIDLVKQLSVDGKKVGWNGLLVGDLTQWPEWTPWQEMDPKMQTTFGEQTTGVGAHQSWWVQGPFCLLSTLACVRSVSSSSRWTHARESR